MPAFRGAAPLPVLTRGGSRRSGLSDIYASDHTDMRQGGGFRWLISTCIAAAVGALAIVVAIFGASEGVDNRAGIIPALQRMGETAVSAPPLEAALRKDDGLKWAIPKSDRLQVTSGAMTTRYMVHDTLKQRRAGRDYIYAKPYVRLVLRLDNVPTKFADVIPPFNPYKLYATTGATSTEEQDRQRAAPSEVDVRVVELIGGILPGEDGQELDQQEVTEFVERTNSAEVAAEAITKEVPPDSGAAGPAASDSGAAPDAAPPHTTLIAKPTSADDTADDFEGLKRFQKTAVAGDTLTKILVSAGAETWQAKEMLAAARSIFPESALKPGFEVQISLTPSVTQQNKLEPVMLSVFDEGHAHKITVMRNAAGEFTASAEPVGEEAALRAALSEADAPQPSSIYASLYGASLMQQVQPETISQILRIHATETDFRRRARLGDSIDMFFDLKDETSIEGPPGELLYTAIGTAGETRRFYRFRAADGSVDFYDDQGNNSRRFLTRRPIRDEDARLVSGFGMRLHPLLNIRRMHTGVDWAAPTGTPILAAGNGVIEEAGHKGGYGNYIRIRHANGYQTAYGHISRYAPGVAPGVKVRQNQLVAYVGCTGLCQGPHVHFEILVNNQFVDPFTIRVPNERQLTDKDLVEFQRERARIDELRARAPVATSTK